MNNKEGSEGESPGECWVRAFWAADTVPAKAVVGEGVVGRVWGGVRCGGNGACPCVQKAGVARGRVGNDVTGLQKQVTVGLAGILRTSAFYLSEIRSHHQVLRESRDIV